MKENKGIARLVAFITDVHPDEEDAKAGGEKGEKGKGKGKKGGSAGGKKKGKGGGDEGSSIFLFLSDLESSWLLGKKTRWKYS